MQEADNTKDIHTDKTTLRVIRRLWGGERGHKGFTNGFTKRMHKRRQHNKHTPKDSQRIAQGDTKGFTKGITTAGPQRDHSGTTAGQQRAAGQPGQQRDNQDNTGTTTGQQRDNPGNSSTFFVAPMSCITRVSLSSGRPRAAQPHHLQRRLSVCAIRWQSLAKCAGSHKEFAKGFSNAMTHALRIPTTTTNSMATISNN